MHLFPRDFRKTYPTLARGKGVYLYDTRGRRYLDGSGGAAVCTIGHGVGEIADAMARQARRGAFAHSSQFVNRPAEELSERLLKLAPREFRRGRVFLTSGGSEAVETALKLARQYWVELGQPSRHKVLSRWQSYHGATLGALAVSGHAGRRKNYEPMLNPSPKIPPVYCYRCPYEKTYPSCEIACAGALEDLIRREGSESVAAFIAEPLSGATLGAVTPPDGYWEKIRDICSRHQVLLIADEVMTGLGRTGLPFAVQHWGVAPDLLVVGKGLSSGYAPLGAVLVREPIWKTIAEGSGVFVHGFTYSAHPVSAAAGVAVLARLERHRLIQRVAELEPYFFEQLHRLDDCPSVGNVRGLGFLAGIELVRDRSTRQPFPPEVRIGQALAHRAFRAGLIVYPGSGCADGRAGDHVLVAPPFIITRPQIRQLVDLLSRGLGAIMTEDRGSRMEDR